VRSVVLLIALTLLTACGLAELYLFVKSLLPPGPSGELWIAAAWVNTLLGAFVLLRWHFEEGRIRLGSAWSWHLPALVIFGGAALVAWITRVALPMHADPDAISSHQPVIQWMFILWVPVIEEALFRVGIGGIFRGIGGGWVGGYFSAMVFSLVHSQPTLDRLLAMDVGLPLGPLFLGIICEWLWVKSRSFAVPVVFHAACNATVAVFISVDPRWLHWLRLLYG